MIVRHFSPPLLAGLLMFGLSASPLAAQATAVAGQENEKLVEFFRRYLEQACALSPTRATRLGDHRHDGLLDDVSAAAIERQQEFARQTLEQLSRSVNYERLSRDHQVDFEILRDSLALDLWLHETERPWENDPRVVTGLATEGVYALLTQSSLPRETNIQHAVERMRRVPALLAAGRGHLRHPPRVRTEIAIQQNRGAIAFYQKDLFKMLGDTPQLQAAQEVAALAAAALQEHQSFLEQELLPRSTGEWRIGKERFSRKLERVLDAGVTADDVQASAKTALAQVHRDMLLVSRQLWPRAFPAQPLPPDDEPGRRETIERVVAWVGQDHGEPETLSGDARETVAQLKQFISANHILRMPDPDSCRIIEMPDFQRGNSVAFLEPAPALDTIAPSIYAISPPPRDWTADRVASFLGEYNRRMLQVLTIHEAYPGHYVQLAYANRHPSLVRRVLGSGVYAEGWANYCEQMMLDQGYGAGDLALRLMQLKFLLRSVANAILDYEMHCGALADDEAVAFLTRQAFQGEGEARLKVIRAKLGSCQLSTYFVGRDAFMRLRRDVQRELGQKFDLGQFHEAVLNLGTVPVKYLPELTRAQLQTLH